jgi:DNA modification methylase
MVITNPENNTTYELLSDDSLAALASLPTNSIDCCVTSPPYWMLRDYGNEDGIGNEPTLDEYVQKLVNILSELKRILKVDGSLWLNIGDTYLKKNLQGVPWRVALALQQEGWILRNAIVWDKVKGNPCNSKDKLRNVYEMMFHLVLNQKYYYNIDALRTAPKAPTMKNGNIVTPTGVSGRKYKQQIRDSNLSDSEKSNAFKALEETLLKVMKGDLPDFRMIIRGVQRSTHSESTDFSGRADELKKKGFCVLPYHKNGSKPGDIWEIIPEDEWRKDSHTAVYPVELCRRPILLTCPHHGKVIDPFCGTGTTLIAASQLGISAVGIDISEEYIRTAESRIRQEIFKQNTQTTQLELATL